MVFRRSPLTQPTHIRLTLPCCLSLYSQIAQVIRDGSKNDLYLHYIFMDNAFELPTGAGVQLQVSSSGIITPGTKAGVRMELANVRLCMDHHQSNDCFFSFRVGFLHTCLRHAPTQGNMNHDCNLLANFYEEFGDFASMYYLSPSPLKMQ